MLDKTSLEYQYIKNTINSLKKRLKYYEDSIIDWDDDVDEFDYGDELDDTSKLIAIESSLQQKLADADASASRFWIEDQIDTLEKILEL